LPVTSEHELVSRPDSCFSGTDYGSPAAPLGNPIWQSDGRHGKDGSISSGLRAHFRTTVADGLDNLDDPDGPPEPVAQVRVLPGALLGCVKTSETDVSGGEAQDLGAAISRRRARAVAS